jgi:hypothetical protein
MRCEGTLVVLSPCQTSSRCRGTRKGGWDNERNRFQICRLPVRSEDGGPRLAALFAQWFCFFARLTDRVPSWIDDLIFIMSTPEHGECAGFEGGCAVCEECVMW